jgi:hypothetical protein
MIYHANCKSRVIVLVLNREGSRGKKGYGRVGIFIFQAAVVVETAPDFYSLENGKSP